MTPDQPSAASGELLASVLERADERGPALICPDDAGVVTHGDLAGAAQRLARELHGLGVRRGDRVAMSLGGGPELVELLLACALLGAAAAPLNPAYTVPELRFFLDDLEPRLLLVAAGEGAAVREAADRVPTIDVRPGRATELAGAAPSEPSEAASPDDIALLLHTSGTTSRPKQVPLLQRNLMAVARAIGAHYELGAGDVSYCAMPLFHVHGLVGSTLSQLAAGGAVVTPRRFAPGRFAAQCGEHSVTWFSAGPTFHQAVLERSPQPAAGLRFLRSCSSALSPELAERCESAYAAPMLQAYGMTEASHQMTSAPLPPGARPAGSVGIPAGARVRVVDEDWREVAAGVPGEVTVSGPGLTPGYLGNPQANAESFRDGWFRTGDEGVVIDGQLYLRGRLKEMIIRGGENISPAEIEDVLRAHPAVAEAVCFGLADDRYGQQVGAAVVPSGAVTDSELRDHCRGSLAAFKVPAKIAVVDDLPRTPTGKLQRRLVAQMLFPDDD